MSQVSQICRLQIDGVILLLLRRVAEHRAPRGRRPPRERPNCEVPLVTNSEPDPPASIPVPRHLTLPAPSRYEAAVREYGAEQYGRSRPPVDPARAGRYLSTALVSVGSIGVGVMSGFLDGAWQVVLFCGFVVLALLGLGLAWTSGVEGTRS
jgi:hypothetical protein